MVMPTILPQGSRLNPRNTFEVCEGMSIQAAINAAAAQVPAPSATNPWTVLIYPGIYTEQITCASYVNLRGIGPSESVIIQQVDATIITLATQVQIENLTVRLETPSVGRNMIIDNGVACVCQFTDIIVEITTPGDRVNECWRFSGASTVIIERCSYNIGGTGAEVGVNNATAGATIKLIGNDFTFTNAAARHIKSTVAGTWRGGLNRFAGTCGLFNVTLGDILLDNDAKVCTGANSRTGGTVFFNTQAGATITVAASNALSIDAANYVCDGVDDQVEIQAAINALPAAGGGIVLSEGNYLLQGRTNYFGAEWACINPTKPLRIQGMGRDKTILKVGDGVAANAIGCRAINLVEISDLTIDGNKANNPNGGVDGNQNGIYIGDSGLFVTLKNIKVINAPRLGIYIGAILQWAYLENIYATLCGLEGIGLDQTNGAIVINPSITRNNILQDANRSGFGITTNALSSFRTIVIGGYYYDNAYAGIRLGFARNVTLLNPHVESNGVTDAFAGFGIMVNNSEEVDIFSPRLEGNRMDGLRVGAGCTHVNVFGGIGLNNCLGGGSGGIKFYGSTYCLVSGFRAYDNQGTKTQIYGIVEEDVADYNTYRDNDLNGNLTAPILIVGTHTRARNNRGYDSEGRQSFVNLLRNGDFEVGDPPTGWLVQGAGATFARSAVQARIGTYSALLTRVGFDCSIYQYRIGLTDYQGRTVTLGCWVWASVAARANIRVLTDGGAQAATSPFHTGGSTWEWLTATVALVNTGLNVEFQILTDNTAAYFDGAMLVEGDSCPAFSPKPDDTLINHHTAAYTISQYETGHVVHTNLGAGGAIQLELPQVVPAGFTCCFAVMAAFELRIHPGAAGAIYINGAKQLDDKYIWADDEGESVALVADGNGDWVAMYAVGTWGVE